MSFCEALLRIYKTHPEHGDFLDCATMDEMRKSNLVLPSSAGGCVQTLSFVDSLFYQWNSEGSFVHARPSLGSRWESVIQCKDTYAMALDVLHRGDVVWVECALRWCTLLSKKEKNYKVYLSRPPVYDTIYLNEFIYIPYYDNDVKGKKPDLCWYWDKKVQKFCVESVEKKGRITYCPLLKMTFKDVSLEIRESDGLTRVIVKLEEFVPFGA